MAAPIPQPVATVAQQFAGIHFSEDESDRAKYSVDGILPRIVLRPDSAEETAAALKSAAENNLAVIPCRNATKLDVGSAPNRYDVALSLGRLNNVWYYEPTDLVVSVEAGMKFGDLQEFLRRAGLWIPLDPPGGAQASIGGILAANGAGPLRLRYGSARDMALGMKVATAEGQIVKMGGRVVKNVAGFDLGKTLIGSWGTLGVIVEAAFKLYPLPESRETYRMAVESLEAAHSLHRGILASPVEPMRAVLLKDISAASERLERSSWQPFEIWIEVGGSTRVLARARREFESMARSESCEFIRLDDETAAAGWVRVTDFRNTMSRRSPASVVLKASLPVARMEEFLRRAIEISEQEKFKLASVSALGAETVYLALLLDDLQKPLDGVVRSLRHAAAHGEGSLVIERAPHELKQRMNVWGDARDDFAVMKRLKDAWDPQRILSPGRFLGGL